MFCVVSSEGGAGIVCGYVGGVCFVLLVSGVCDVVYSVCGAGYDKNGQVGRGCRCFVHFLLCRPLSVTTCVFCRVFCSV